MEKAFDHIPNGRKAKQCTSSEVVDRHGKGGSAFSKPYSMREDDVSVGSALTPVEDVCGSNGETCGDSIFDRPRHSFDQDKSP